MSSPIEYFGFNFAELYLLDAQGELYVNLRSRILFLTFPCFNCDKYTFCSKFAYFSFKETTGFLEEYVALATMRLQQWQYSLSLFILILSARAH